jgi:hypothetical protein
VLFTDKQVGKAMPFSIFLLPIPNKESQVSRKVGLKAAIKRSKTGRLLLSYERVTLLTEVNNLGLRLALETTSFRASIAQEKIQQQASALQFGY